MRHFWFIFLFLFPLACFSEDTIKITLYPRDTLKTIPSDFAGLSFEKNCLNKGLFGPHRDTLIRLFQTCGIKSMRVGGNSVDRDTLTTDTTGTDTTFTKRELDSLFLFAKQAGCKILLGLNLRDSNVSLANTEASYVIQYYDSALFGFEVGNEPDLYAKHRHRKTSYWDTNYVQEFMHYYDTIKHYNSTAVFTGPASSSNYKEFTLPFCRIIDTISPLPLSMLTQHYYGGKKDTTITIAMQFDTLMDKDKLRNVSTEVRRLVKCADSSGIPFRMSESNSLDDGGQQGVSNAFVSALWALDYMYQLAHDSCAGVNFHGALEGAYTVFSRYGNIYRARPIAYGILAFQIGSKGRFISDTVAHNNRNLDSYSVIDGLNNIYTTIINKEIDTSKKALINLAVTDTGNSNYLSAEYVLLKAGSLGDTLNVSLGGQVVNSMGTIPAYNWTSLPVTSHTTKFSVHAGSAIVVKFNYQNVTAVIDNSDKNEHFLNLYPNPTSGKLTVITGTAGHSVISIYNLQGQILLQQQAQQAKTDIDLSEIPKGVYIFRLYSKSGAEAGKIIKE